MKRPDPTLEEPALFDLPLHEPAAGEPKRAAAARRRPVDPAPQAMSLFPERDESGGTLRAPAPEVTTMPQRPEPARPGPRPVPAPATPARVGLAPRALSGLADLSVHVAVAVLLVAGSRALGVERALPWPPLAICLLLFSFVYFVVPLAFWGNTPGMAWRGLQARARGGAPLSFGQASRRWLGGLLTVLGAGIPALGALRGRSFADLLSASSLRSDR